jgi:hypothetical protein
LIDNQLTFIVVLFHCSSFLFTVLYILAHTSEITVRALANF